MLFNKVASTIWNQTILLPAMAYVYPDIDVSKLTDKELKKLRNRKEVKDCVSSIALLYIKDPKAMVDFVPIFIRCCRAFDNPINEEAEAYIPQLLKARLVNIEPPKDANDNKAWAKINKKFDEMYGNPLQEQ